MVDVELKKRGVYLGKTGETGRYRVWLDVSAWDEEYEGGVGLLLYTDPKGNTAPMRTVKEFDGEKTKLYGYVTAEETKEAGTGVIEARWENAGVVAKSDHFNTVVMASSYTGKNIGENTPDWVRDLMTELNAADVLLKQAAQVAEDVAEISENIEEAETVARASALDSEAWAVGERDGEAVDEDDPTYGNNARKYAQDAGGSAAAAGVFKQEAEAWAKGTKNGQAVPASDPAYEKNAKYYADKAGEDAEAWANGTRNGTDVDSTDPAYHKNAKYYSEQAFSGTPEGYADLVGDVGDLKSAMDYLYSMGEHVTDMFGSSASVEKSWNAIAPGTWTAAQKKLSVTMTSSGSSASTYYVSLAPKLISGHTYKIAIKYHLSTSRYIYIANSHSLSNINSKDEIVWGTSISDGEENVYTVTPTADGWLSLGVRISAEIQDAWQFDIACYDVTGVDVSTITNEEWLALANIIAINGSGLIVQMQSDIEQNSEDIEDINGDIVDINNDISDTNDRVDALYGETKTPDLFGSNAEVAKTWKSAVSASWSAANKKLSVTQSTAGTSSTTYFISMAPKFVNGHKYKLVVKYHYSSSHYTTIMITASLSNVNTKQDILVNGYRADGESDVFTVDATMDGWLSLSPSIPADVTENWAYDIALYDITGLVVTAPDSDFLAMPDEVVVSTSGMVGVAKEEADYAYKIVSNMIGKTASALGDSLTATGSGGLYLGYVKDTLYLGAYYNCGIGGTLVSGASNENAMWQDVRINSLNIGSNIVTVMGGTNDIWQEYYEDHPGDNLAGWGDCTRENHDVKTFCGAYNVMLSKILYKFCRVAGYYQDVDYSGIIQVTTPIENFRLILLTPPQCFHSSFDTMSETIKTNGCVHVHSYVKQLAELWGLPCVDTWEMGMNAMSKSLFYANPATDGTHFNALGHERLASLLIDKMVQISRYK